MKPLAFFFIVISLLSACRSKPMTNIDYNAETNFQKLVSYQFNPKTDISLDANPIMIFRIKTAIDSLLTKKGFTKQNYIDKHSADLTIQVSFSEEEAQDNSIISLGIGTSSIGSNSRTSIGLNTHVPLNDTASIITTITIDMSNAEQTIWHGSDSYKAKNNLSIEQKDQAVNATVYRLLANFPPKM